MCSQQLDFCENVRAPGSRWPEKLCLLSQRCLPTTGKEHSGCLLSTVCSLPRWAHAKGKRTLQTRTWKGGCRQTSHRLQSQDQMHYFSSLRFWSCKDPVHSKAYVQIQRRGPGGKGVLGTAADIQGVVGAAGWS